MNSILQFLHRTKTEKVIQGHAMDSSDRRGEGTESEHQLPPKHADCGSNLEEALFDQKIKSFNQESCVDGTDMVDADIPVPNRMNHHESNGNSSSEEEEQEQDEEEDEDGEDETENAILSERELGTVLEKLKKAISNGNYENGCKMLKELTNRRAKVWIRLLSIPKPYDDPFYIHVTVETAIMAPVALTWQLQVRPSMTIYGMKMKVALLYRVPISVQRWIIGKKIANNHETIRGNGVTANSNLVLFLVKKEGDTEQEMMVIKGFQQKLLMEGISNIELNFNEEEYNKYLQEERKRPQSSHEEICHDQLQDGLYLNQQFHQMEEKDQAHRMNGESFYENTRMSSSPYHQQQVRDKTQDGYPDQFHQMEEKDQLAHRMNGEPNFHENHYRMGLPQYHQQQVHNTQRTTELPQRGLPFSPMSRQPDVTESRSANGRNEVFPPSDLVQRGPMKYFGPAQSQEVDQRVRSFDPTSGRKTLPPQQVRRRDDLDTEARRRGHSSMQTSRRLSLSDLRVQSQPQFVVPPQLSRTDSLPRSFKPPNVFQEQLNVKEDIETLFEDGPHHRKQRQTAPKKKKSRREPLRRPCDFSGQENWSMENNGGWKEQEEPFIGREKFRIPQPASSRRRHRNQQLPTADEVGWGCPQCTFINPPRVPGCRQCSHERPEDYEIPKMGSYVMDKDEARIEASFETNEQAFAMMQVHEKETERLTARKNRARLYQATEYNLITNDEVFECPICFSEIEPGQGIRLQECLHELCRDCCANHVRLSEDAEVKCPYTDGDNACQQTILEREIKQIVGREGYNDIIERSLKTAEASSPNTFHCLTPDCKGWCFYDEEHNFFHCPICKQMNCLTCKVSHEGQNCKQYQDDLNLKARNDETARQNQEALQQMLRDGRAMNCPKCGVVIQKKGGCPNMTCSVCRTGFRWTGVDM